MLDAYIYGGLRSPFGRHAGMLATVRPDDLAAEVITALFKQYPFKPEQLSDIILGCVTQSGEDCRNIARFAGLLAGLPPSIPGVTVNRLCASGLQAVVDAARAITCGEGDLYLSGGVESMTRAPFVLAKSTSAYTRDFKMHDTTIGSRFTNPRFAKLYGDHTMPQTGDNVASEFGVSRLQADQFALRSQERFRAAQQNGFIRGEITPITLSPQKRGQSPTVVDTDEHPRVTDLDGLGQLKPLFEGGVVTAGNASGINDGAAALFVGSRAIGEKMGVPPIARIISAASAAVEPRIMGVGPAWAIPLALQRAGLNLKDLDIIEINEAFASQVLACLKVLNVDFADNRVNPNGGAIAVGHPLGASGARLAITVARQLQKQGGRYAAVSLCIGVGQGLALILERV